MHPSPFLFWCCSHFAHLPDIEAGRAIAARGMIQGPGKWAPAGLLPVVPGGNPTGAGRLTALYSNGRSILTYIRDPYIIFTRIGNIHDNICALTCAIRPPLESYKVTCTGKSEVTVT